MSIIKLRVLEFKMKIRLHLRYYLIIRTNLKKQLKKIIFKSYDRKKILIPLIETNHYQHFQLLILAKALELRGARVEIIICDSYLEGCEIKSTNNENFIDPCYTCKFNQNKTLPFFGLKTIKLSEIIDLKTKSEIFEVAKDIYLNNKILYKGFDLTVSVNDSVLRYFYGNISVDKEYLNRVKLKHTFTSIISLETAIKTDKDYSPDIILNNTIDLKKKKRLLYRWRLMIFIK
jgi:hypothetical protein